MPLPLPNDRRAFLYTEHIIPQTIHWYVGSGRRRRPLSTSYAGVADLQDGNSTLSLRPFSVSSLSPSAATALLGEGEDFQCVAANADGAVASNVARVRAGT